MPLALGWWHFVMYDDFHHTRTPTCPFFLFQVILKILREAGIHTGEHQKGNGQRRNTFFNELVGLQVLTMDDQWPVQDFGKFYI